MDSLAVNTEQRNIKSRSSKILNFNDYFSCHFTGEGTMAYNYIGKLFR